MSLVVSSLFAEAETLKMLFTAPCVQGLRMSKVVHPRNGPGEALPWGSWLPTESSRAYRVHQSDGLHTPHGPRIALL